MKITIDRENTTIAKLPLVREKIKQFKSYFTEGDLLRMYTENTDHYVSGDILKCEAEAYQSYSFSDDVNFYVEIVVDKVICFSRIRFFIHEENNSYVFHEDPMTITHDTFYRLTKGA